MNVNIRVQQNWSVIYENKAQLIKNIYEYKYTIFTFDKWMQYVPVHRIPKNVQYIQ